MSSGELHPVPAWGHGEGFLSLGAGAPVDGAVRVVDRLAIVDRLHRYCWSYDERRAEQLRDCFTQDGVWEGNVMGEIPIGPFTGVDEIVRWLTEFWPHQRDQRRHMFVNTIVEDQQDETATALAYLLLFGARNAAVRLETTAFYRLALRKEGEQWRLAHLFAGFDAPFWPGALAELTERARRRHGIGPDLEGKS